MSVLAIKFSQVLVKSRCLTNHDQVLTCFDPAVSCQGQLSAVTEYSCSQNIQIEVSLAMFELGSTPRPPNKANVLTHYNMDATMPWSQLLCSCHQLRVFLYMYDIPE